MDLDWGGGFEPFICLYVSVVSQLCFRWSYVVVGHSRTQLQTV